MWYTPKGGISWVYQSSAYTDAEIHWWLGILIQEKKGLEFLLLLRMYI